MAHVATKRFSYVAQLGILLGLIAAGILVGMVASIVPVLGKLDFSNLTKLSNKELMNSLLVPENANALRAMQFLSTFFMMCLPAYLYAKICHNKPFTHLGLVKKPSIEQLGLVVLIMIACMPVVGALQEVIKLIPFSKETLQTFKNAEDEYFKQIVVIGRMNGFGDYILSLLVIALLPAIFEEMIFRGAIQNLLSRYTKMPIFSLVFTSAIFSLVHGSYIGFLPRLLLGFVLGWLFYRTNKLWLSAFAHFLNNAIGVTVLYALSKTGKPITPNSLNDHFPVILGVAALAALVGLLFLFDKVSKNDINQPGQEVKLPGYIDMNNPFADDYLVQQKNNF